MFYVYAWYNKETKEIFYVGKGSRNRYKQIRKRNRLFTEYINTHDCKEIENVKGMFVNMTISSQAVRSQ